MDSRHRTVSSTSKVLLFPAAFQWEPNAACAKILIDEVFPRLVAIFPDCVLCSPAAPRQNRGFRHHNRYYALFCRRFRRSGPLASGERDAIQDFSRHSPRVYPSSARKREPKASMSGTRFHLVFAESGDQLVDAVRKIWLEEGLANRLVANGLELVRRAYSWPAISSVLHAALEDLGRNN
jgi:hypothetical protein